MAAPTNMELFDAFTLALFKQLYESFPTPIDIDASKIAFDLIPEDVGKEDGMRLFKVADDSVLWLQKEGLIEAGYTSMDSASEFSDVLLTSRGLAVLQSVPDDAQPGQSLASQIGDVFEEAGKDLAKDELKKVYRGLMAAVMKLVMDYGMSGGN